MGEKKTCTTFSTHSHTTIISPVSPLPTLHQLYWPDDELWYLVEVVSITPRAAKATVRYTNAEVEALDLDDVVRDGHMSLLSL